jgi:hypothetical protein
MLFSKMFLQYLAYSRENYIEVLCLLAHTTCALQPLDNILFKPSKTFYASHKLFFKNIPKRKTKYIQ